MPPWGLKELVADFVSNVIAGSSNGECYHRNSKILKCASPQLLHYSNAKTVLLKVEFVFMMFSYLSEFRKVKK